MWQVRTPPHPPREMTTVPCCLPTRVDLSTRVELLLFFVYHAVEAVYKRLLIVCYVCLLKARRQVISDQSITGRRTEPRRVEFKGSRIERGFLKEIIASKVSPLCENCGSYFWRGPLKSVPSSFFVVRPKRDLKRDNIYLKKKTKVKCIKQSVKIGQLA